MKRILAKIGHIFRSRGFLKLILWTITLILFLYAEEDWRGARAWAATKAEWEAKGESFDYAKLIPPPVPDSENLALIPFFKMERAPENPTIQDLVAKALQSASREKSVISYRGNWQSGELTDTEELRQMMEANYREAFPTAPVPRDALAQFDQVYPSVADLLLAAKARPYCRFPQDYPPQQPLSQSFALSIGQIKTSKILTLRGDLALAEGKPDLALEAIAGHCKVLGGLTQEPMLISGLVAVGMTAINLRTVYNGLALHVWNDAQLTQLEHELANIDFLTTYQNAIRGELLGIVIPTLDEARLDRPALIRDLDKARIDPGMKNRLFPFYWPVGWLDELKADTTSMDLGAVHLMDAKTRVIDVGGANRPMNQAWSPWQFFLTALRNPLVSAVEKFSRMQIWVDETRIACGLERYRLVHGTYPDSLMALTPAYIDQVPHDIMTGKPYHYRLRPDGTFLLYSVGWNQKDDGGKVVYREDNSEWVDDDRGDWVWPTPQTATEKSP